MLRFECDYGEGAAPAVLELLQKTNFDQTPGYGEDEYCAKAAAQIKRLCDAPDADVHFFVGATQANLTVIAAALKPWQGVLCADSGHIHVHETGSIEAGKAADLCAVRLNAVDALPCYDPASHLIYVLGREAVSDVWVNGRPALKEGCLLQISNTELSSLALLWQNRLRQ